MKKPVALSLLALSLGIIACGKGNDAAVVSGGAVQVSNPPYIQPPVQPGLTLAQDCYSRGGQMANASLCTISQQFSGGSGGWTFNVNIGGPYATINPYYGVYAGQRVAVTASGGARIYVGNTYVGSGSVSFVANVSGQLQYYLTSLTVNGGVQSVTLTTCLNAPGQVTACP